MKDTAAVVIIGGGIQGISLAYHLALRGQTDVSVIEMNTLGSGSSGRSATVTGHCYTSENCLPLVILSYAALMRFPEELGSDAGFRKIGFLVLRSHGSESDLRQRHARLQKSGVESQLLGPDAIVALTPGLNVEDIGLGLITPQDGVIDPHDIMMAYTKQARRLGVRFFEGVRAQGLEVQGGRVVGVRTTAGVVSSPCAVNAAGFGARRVATWAGMNLPITNYKRHIFVTGPVSAYADEFPFTDDIDGGWYFRREGPGLIVGMGKHRSDEEDPQVDWSFLDQVVEFALHRAPALADARIINGWAGLRSLTPDEDPILGEAPHLQGFFNDCGWAGHGVMNSPAGGMILSDLILSGQTERVDVEPFRVDRFRGWLGAS